MSEKELEVQRHGTMYLISSIGITLVGFLATMFYAHWIGPGLWDSISYFFPVLLLQVCSRIWGLDMRQLTVSVRERTG